MKMQNYCNFYKYNACGNDFILIDQRGAVLHNYSKKAWAILCSRRIGIGADGVILLKSPLRTPAAHLAMSIINADGAEVDMCGNGLRALAAFTRELNLFENEKTLHIETLAGSFFATMQSTQEWGVQMIEARDISKFQLNDLWPDIKGQSLYLDTGVPHVVLEHLDIETLDIARLAPSIRHDPRFPKGTNVNWMQIMDENNIRVRTFERGVEGETLSCGTGVTASAYAYWRWNKNDKPLIVHTRGGVLSLEKNSNGAVMTGPVKLVFKGEFKIEDFISN